MNKRILATLLALVLCLSLFSLPVLAAGPRIWWLDIKASNGGVSQFSYSAVLDQAFVVHVYGPEGEWVSDKYTIDLSTGSLVEGCEWDLEGDVSDTLAKVSQGDGDYWQRKYGLVNKDGQVVVPIEYSRINSFSDGLAMVAKKDAQGDYSSGYIDQEGRFVIPLSPRGEACDFSDGLARVTRIVDGYARGNVFINTNGNEVISLDRYDYYSDRFSDGLAWVCEKDELGELRYGCIDTYGKLVIPLSYREAHDFSEGLALVATDEHRCFINTQGETVFTVDEYPDVGQFSSGLARACTRDGKSCFINTEGEIAISLDDYASAGDFTGGLAAVRIDQRVNNQTTREISKYGLIDTQGQVVLPVEYDMVYIAVSARRSDGDAPSAAVLVREGDRYGVLKFDHGKPAGSLLLGNWSAGILLPVVCIAIAAIVAAVIAFVVVKKKKATPSRVCPSCGKPLRSNVKFCPHCGCNVQP